MVCLLNLASQHLIVSALSEYQRVFLIAGHTGTLIIILVAEVNSFLAYTLYSPKSVGAIQALPGFRGEAAD